jgi:hypothetical protein
MAIRDISDDAGVLLEDLPPFQHNDADVRAVLDACAAELVRFRAQRDILLRNANPNTAVEYLGLWELLVGLPVSENLDAATRRARVMAFYSTLDSGASGQEWESLLAILLGASYDYQEHDPAKSSSPPDGVLRIIVPSATSAQRIADVRALLLRITPAQLVIEVNGQGTGFVVGRSIVGRDIL